MDIRQILDKVAEMHPYKVVGDSDSYSDYAQGWTDAVNEIDSLLPTSMSGTNDAISRQAAIEAIVGCTNIKSAEGLREYVKKHNLGDGWSGGVLVAINAVKDLPSAQPEQKWIPVSERLPDKEFEEGLENGTVYDLYPCLVTRYATHSPVNPIRLYVAKHYYDGNDFLNYGEIECTEAVVAWMPLPEPYTERREE